VAVVAGGSSSNARLTACRTRSARLELVQLGSVVSGWLLRQRFFDGLQEVPDAGVKSHGSLPGVPRSSGGLPDEDLVRAASLEDGWRMGQGTMTDTGGPQGFTRNRSITSINGVTSVA
jgi:hypothetical protein